MVGIVLHHGLFGGEKVLGPISLASFSGIDDAISSEGFPVLVSNVHPTASIAHRAQQLKETILANRPRLGQEKLVLVAHSLGGLDARYMLARMDMAKYISTLVTITTPHRGSPYADWCVRNLGIRLGGLRLMQWLGLDVRGIIDLMTDSCARFNEQIPDVPGVTYYSVSAARPWHQIPPFALHAHHVVYTAEGANDGLVSVQSSIWGKHLGTWSADHWHTVNRRYVPELRNPTGDIAPYYVSVIQRVLGLTPAVSAV